MGEHFTVKCLSLVLFVLLFVGPFASPAVPWSFAVAAWLASILVIGLGWKERFDNKKIKREDE